VVHPNGFNGLVGKGLAVLPHNGHGANTHLPFGRCKTRFRVDHQVRRPLIVESRITTHRERILFQMAVYYDWEPNFSRDGADNALGMYRVGRTQIDFGEYSISIVGLAVKDDSTNSALRERGRADRLVQFPVGFLAILGLPGPVEWSRIGGTAS